MRTALVIHGHFYQPPRENPWTGEIDREPGADPFHDWNERIYHECYRPNANARIFDDHGRITRLVNNYQHLSFNFGPTLMSWLQRHHPATYAKIIEADRESARRRGGHGNAIAQAYNHAILPLLDERDRTTQIRWGITDFRARFGRAPEAMWLPECAVNDATLASLVREGIRFVILAPQQAARFRRIGEDRFTPVGEHGIDTGVAYRWFTKDAERRSIDIFFYDGARSRAIAFEGGLSSSRGLIEHFTHARGGSGRLVAAATDGESYGHHFKWGDRCIAHAMEVEAEKFGFWVTNFGEFLERNPPIFEAEVSHGDDGLGSSWSCAHGVGRWHRDCGCHTGGGDDWNQRWRTPVRAAVDFVKKAAAEAFESAGGDLFRDPWAARDAYIDVLLEPTEAARKLFLSRHARRPLGPDEETRALALLEMQKNALLMYTSCGWFFSDISGIETLQVLKYAARALDRMDSLGLPAPRDDVRAVLAEAQSNRRGLGTGADIYDRTIEASRVTPARVAAHLTIAGLVDGSETRGSVGGYAFERRASERREDGRIKVATGLVDLRDEATSETHALAVGAMHFGGVDFYCLVRPSPGEKAFRESSERIWKSFPTASLPQMLRRVQAEFGPDEFGLEHVLPGGREHVSRIVFGELVDQFRTQYARLYEEHRRTLDMLHAAGFELPKELRAAAEFTLGRRFEEEIASQHHSPDPAAYKRALEIANEVAEHGYRIDRTISTQIFRDMVNARVFVATTRRRSEDVEAAISLLELTQRLGIGLSLDLAQEAVYEALRGPMEPGIRPSISRLANLLGVRHD